MSYGASAYPPVWENIIGYTRPQYIRPYAKRPNADELALSLRDELADGLVLYLPFVRFVSHRPDTLTKVFDRSPYNNHGTINGAVWQTLPSGKSALSFNGANAYVDCGDIDAIGGASEITVMAWVKWEGAVGGLLNPREFHRKNNVYAFGGGWKDHKARFWIYDTSWKHSGDSITDIDDGNFHFIAGVYDGEYLRIYVDGVEESNNYIGSTTLNVNTEHVIIGSSRGIGEFWKGIIDGVRDYILACSEKGIERLFNLTRVFYDA